MDYITYDTKGIWRCYEIKVSKSDFYSPAKVSFVGHYNYYVMPKELYEEVKGDIPLHVGVIVNGNWTVKRPKKQKLQVSENVLKDSMIRSLYREVEKSIRSENPLIVESLERQIYRLKQDIQKYRDRYSGISNRYYEKRK